MRDSIHSSLGNTKHNVQLNTAIGGQASAIYLIISDVGTNSGEGLDFVHGVVFLERFYLAYDSGNAEVGLANTPFTFASSN